ncbi:fanconi anemia group J protein [Caerostris darwini]|uniref:Fanconi anemia group J protein n=1 Tax=Caerostris darwini TaxID=1538125 RepID=A0AAV4RNN2_9ARAC|nr:fanconi anemia group J protein [Caerostris darwini]
MEVLNECSISNKAYTIGGVPILFPYKAYPSQITMMDKIIKCLNKKQNCLLESPTGSGKSLALLCACLAWQKKVRKEIDRQEFELENELNVHGVAVPDETKNVNLAQANIHNTENKSMGINYTDNHDLDEVISKIKYKEMKNRKGGTLLLDGLGRESYKPSIPVLDKASTNTIDNSKNYSSKASTINIVGSSQKKFAAEDDLDDFQPVKKYRSSMDNNFNITIQTNSSADACLEQSMNISACETDSPKPEIINSLSDCSSVCCDSPNEKEKHSKDVKESTIPNKLPRIYFGTRTHKQIEQIIRELKKTPYKNSKMVILSSRERTCIHPEASKADNKNDACDELIKADGGPACKFFRNAKSISHCHPAKFGNAFDLEDFVGTCKRVRACPYFASRELLLTSDIIFCPYNYLIDPLIRSAMSISLKGNIVVTDEAHNIEDSARDAASGKISLSQLEETVLNLEKARRYSKTIPECYELVEKTLSNLVSWLKGNIHNLTDYTTFDSSAKVFAGDIMLAILNYVELGPEHFPLFKKTFEKILAEETESEKEQIVDMDKPKLLGSTLQCLKTLTQILSYILKDNLIFVPDYRCVIIKSKVSSQSKKKYLPTSSFQITLNFWCLNPSVAFSDLKNVIHSIIVASGTLSPLASFQTELGMPFQISLEANHVISKSQLWVGTVGKGPNNNILNATYHNTSTFAFQDDVGELIYQVCCVIPHGVLCFCLLTVC